MKRTDVTKKSVPTIALQLQPSPSLVRPLMLISPTVIDPRKIQFILFCFSICNPSAFIPFTLLTPSHPHSQ